MRADFVWAGAGGGGGGKGGGSGGGLSEADDSLKATSYAQVLDLISEGEIGGLVDGAKSIFLDGTPLQNADGSYNFKNVTWAATNGTQTQGVIAGYDDVRSEVSVAVKVSVSGGPVVRSITDANVTSLVVTVRLPALTYLDDKGNLGGTSVNYAIDINNNGGGWVEFVNDTVTGKSSGEYQRQYRILLPSGGPWDVRVRRITADSTSTRLVNETWFQSYTEIIDAKLNYPNSALVGVKVDASQFTTIPTRGYDVKLLNIRIPTNATVRADGSLAYSGSWDGTFTVAWCADPAWCYYDLLTADRYGLGEFIDLGQVSKWDMYAISQYCAALIDDGFGGTEPRFNLNVWINTRQEAFKLLSDLSSAFRGMAYWGSGAISVVQDAPADPVYLFTNANVVDGLFSYQGSSAKARHTVALVTWNDPADLYRQKVEYVEDTAGIARYGVVETEVVAFGCTSRGQAHRVGRWLLYSERLETELVTFKTGAEGVMVRPGDVIKVADQHRAGSRQGGRIVAATASSVTVDSLTDAPASGSTLYVIDPAGGVQEVTTGAVTGTTIAVSPPLSPIPAGNAVWVLSTSAVAAQTFRVLTVADDGDGSHEITALEHNPGKYALVESGLALQGATVSALNQIPAAPTGLTLTQGAVTVQDIQRIAIDVAWAAAEGAARYIVDWRAANGNWQRVYTYAAQYEIIDAQIADYEVRVTALNSVGTPSAGYASDTITVSASGGLVRGCYRLLSRTVAYPLTSNDTSISIAAFDGVLDDTSTVSFPSGSITSLSSDTVYSVFYNLGTGAYTAVAPPASAQMADKGLVYIYNQATSTGGSYTSGGTPPGGYRPPSDGTNIP